MANLSNINGKFVVEQTTGYVGVGTTDPNYPIEVLNASAEIALNASGGSIYRLQSDSTDSFRINKNGVGDRLVIDGSGNSTFSGNVTLDNILLTPATLPAINTPSISLRSTNNEIYFQSGSANIFNFMKADYTTMLNLDGTNSATFAGNVALENFISIDSIATGSPYIDFKQDGTQKSYIQYADSTDALTLQTDGQLIVLIGSTEKFKIDTFGNSTFAGNVTAQGGVDITGTNEANSTLELTNTAAFLDNSWSLVPQSANPDLALLEGNTTRVTFKSGGNVIFNGAIGIGGANYGTSGQVLTSNGNAAPSWQAAGGSSPWTTSGNNIYYTTGNVGIGNTNPAKKLEISSATSGDGILLTGDGTGGGMSTGSYRGIGFSYTDTDTSYGSEIKFEIPDSANHGGQISFWTDVYTSPGTLTRAMTIDRNQNVGIGTSTPLAKLDVQGSLGQLFSVTDNLTGSIFAVSDISGVPILDVNSSGVSYFDGKVGIGQASPESFYLYYNNLVIGDGTGRQWNGYLFWN